MSFISDIIINGRKYRGLRNKRRFMGQTKADIINMTDNEFAAFLLKKRKKLGQTQPRKLKGKQFSKEVRPVKILRLHFKNVRNDITKKECPILDAAYPERNNKNGWIRFSNRKPESQKSFDLHEASLLDNPVETFKLLAAIAKAEANCAQIQMNYRSGICADISPILILRLMIEKFPTPAYGFLKGLISEEYEDIFRRLHLDGPLRINTIIKNNDIEEESQENLAIPLKNWSPTKNFESKEEQEKFNQSALERVGDTAESVANRLVEWVKTHGNPQCLIPDLHNRVRSAVSEILDNARRHGVIGEDHCEWHMCGLLQKRTNTSGKTFTVCNLAIVNRGDSIIDTLKTAEPSVKKKIEEYTRKHKGLVPEEALWTVCSLQDDISCTHTEESGERPSKGRGIATAMMDVLNDAFDREDIDYKPSFTIVSGKSWVTASHPYNKFHQDEFGRRTLALNTKNDLSLPPDLSHVGELPWHFPGTIISFRFMVNIEVDKAGDAQ